MTDRSAFGGDIAGGPTPSGEHRLLPSLTVLVLITLPFLLPEHLSNPVHWLLGGVEAVLLVALLVIDPGRLDRRSDLIRTLSIALVALLLAAAGVAVVTLVVDLLEGASEFASAGPLLATGALVWLDANLTFALMYWELDGGGPAERLHYPRPEPDLAFVQHVNPDLAAPGWRPTFIDYLYLALTNALAMSPTDVMPMAHWPKVMMGIQSIISLTVLSLAIANAVNLLS